MAGNNRNPVPSLKDEEIVQQTRRTETAPVSSSNSTTSLKHTIEQQTKFSLEDLKTLFKSAIDPEVVEMIWQDSNENSDVALMFLTEISPNSPPIATTVKMSSWSGVLGSNNSKPFTENQGVKPKSIVKQKHRMLDPIQLRLNNLEKILILMRGVPGSGKSYLAHQLKGNGVVLSADDYFINYQGQYVFDRNLLGVAHEWNQKRANKELQKGTNPVIIDNTNLEAWEMQPYVIMALRYNYSIELIEPDTPWREDVRILSQKNIHYVPREKIKEMLEKQKVLIDISAVVENCRQKMSQSFRGTVTSAQTNSKIAEVADVELFNAEADQSPVPQKAPAITNYQIASSSSLVSITRKNWCDEQLIEKSASMPHIAQASGNHFLQKTVASPLLEALMTNDAAVVSKPSTAEAAIQTSLFETEPPLRELTARSRSIQSAKIAPDLGKKLYSSKYSLDKGCLTDEIVEELAAREALAILKSYFPTKETDDLADILKQCNGDLTWAINVLLDSGYECANVLDYMELEVHVDKFEDQPNPFNSVYDEAVENILQQTKEEETNSVTSSEASQKSFLTTSATLEETESVRRHIEECFQLTDTISEQTRRICGKDYNQFRASQLQKSRYSQNHLPEATSAPTIPINSVPLESQIMNDTCHLSLASFPTLGEQVTYASDYQSPLYMNTESEFGMNLLQPLSVVSPPLPEEDGKVDEGPMISMTLDPSFIQQLVKLFGVPDLKAKRGSSTTRSNPVNLDIPWSLAEQIYLHWCSSLISENEEMPTSTEDRKELQNIMDFELAMQLVQNERIAERKELRESLSTRLSFQMLQENYPSVDPLALDALFEANNYNYSHTVTALNASLGTKPQPPKMQVISANSRVTKEETQARTPKRESKPTQQEPRDLRTEAFLYNKLRQQYSTQAQEYHQRGMSAAAMYYSSESRRYAELYRKCNQQAALQIIEEKNAYQDERTIDLHELHVVEALTCLESFIVENIREGRNVVQVITGRGNNSQNGKPRIKPAVVTFLKQKRYGYVEVNPGMLRVFLSRSMAH